MYYDNPYDYTSDAREMLLMSPSQRAYVEQMTFVLQSYEGREPETTNLSRHLYHYTFGYAPAPDFVMIKKQPISPHFKADKKK
jgi:hypothetical protein